MRDWGVLDDAVRMELMKGIQSRRFERASVPEALLALVKSVPEGEGKHKLRKGVLEELQEYYDKLGDRRALTFVEAASNRDVEDFDIVADSVFKQLERQL
jgi:hypothetical protein